MMCLYVCVYIYIYVCVCVPVIYWEELSMLTSSDRTLLKKALFEANV
jgi:hypothetical protein